APKEPRGALIRAGAAGRNVIAKAMSESKTAGTIIGGAVGAITGTIVGRASAAESANQKHDPVSEPIAILNQKHSVDTVSMTLGVVEDMGPRAEPAIPAIMRNAERLGFLKDHMLGKGNESEEKKRFVEMMPALERIIKAVLHKNGSTKTRHRTPCACASGE